MDIRPALPSEAPALTDLARSLFRSTYSGQIPPEDIERYVATAFHPEAQLDEITTPGGTVLVALEGGELLAYAQLRPSSPPGALEVARFYVAPPWHGTGLAGSLMEACLAWAAPAGYRAISLQVWEENPRAIRFYVRQGFKDQGATTFQVGTRLYHDRIMGRAL